jgi:predicted MFS family arabinose efflux permease
MRSFVSERGLRQMTDAQTVSNADAMHKAAAAEGWGMFNLGFGAGGAVGTIAEHVLEMGGLKNVNGAMTNLGLFMTVWQVNIDLCSGDNRSVGL